MHSNFLSKQITFIYRVSQLDPHFTVLFHLAELYICDENDENGYTNE